MEKYLLKPEALGLTYQQWRNLGGCGIPNWLLGEMVNKAGGHVTHLERKTLLELNSINSYISRGFGRFAFTVMKRPDLAHVA